MQDSDIQRRSIPSNTIKNDLHNLIAIPTCGSQLEPKNNNSIYLYFENINRLPINNRAWRITRKYKRLKQL